MKNAADSDLVFGGMGDYKRKLMADQDSAARDSNLPYDNSHYKASKQFKNRPVHP